MDTNKEGLTFPDIRNKLSPFTNLIAMLEDGRLSVNHHIVQNEIAQCKESIEYLKGPKDE